MGNRLVVSPEVERLLGPDVILAWAAAIEKYSLPCIGCSERIDPDPIQQVTLSVAFLTPEDGGDRPVAEVLLAHEGCYSSTFIDATEDDEEQPSSEEDPFSIDLTPTAFSLLKETGTRAVIGWTVPGVRLGIPVGDRENLDMAIRSLLAHGLQLVTCPFLEFETPAEDWRVEIRSDRQLYMIGPSVLRLVVSSPALPADWLAAATEQGRCVLLATATLTDASEAEMADPGGFLLRKLQVANIAGRLAGGVVPITVDPAVFSLPPHPVESAAVATGQDGWFATVRGRFRRQPHKVRQKLPVRSGSAPLGRDRGQARWARSARLAASGSARSPAATGRLGASLNAQVAAGMGLRCAIGAIFCLDRDLDSHPD